MNPVILTVLQELSELATHPSTAQPGPPTSEKSVIPSMASAEVVQDDDEVSPIPEEMNEVEQILNDLERGVIEETLPCLTEFLLKCI